MATGDDNVDGVDDDDNDDDDDDGAMATMTTMTMAQRAMGYDNDGDNDVGGCATGDDYGNGVMGDDNNEHCGRAVWLLFSSHDHTARTAHCTQPV